MNVGQLKEALRHASDDEIEVVVALADDAMYRRLPRPVHAAYEETLDGPFRIEAGRAPK